MSNTLLTSSILAKETLAVIENNCAFGGMVNRDYETVHSASMQDGYEPGATINIRKPSRYTYRSGRVSVPQASVDNSVPLTLSQGGADLNFNLFERSLQITDRRIQKKINAAAATIVNEIDRVGLLLAKTAVYNCLNPTGALPTTQALSLAAITGINQRLDEMGAPRDNMRGLIMNPAMNAATVGGFAGLFNGQAKLGRQFDSGLMVDSLGLSYAMDQNVAVHTNGAATATNISGGGQTGAAITVVAVAGGTLAAGTVITLPGVYAVNPQSRVSTGVLADFVVTADVSAAATSIPISPAIVTSGPYQNVTASPTTGQPYVIKGAASTSYGCNVGFHEDAFTLAMVPMATPPDGTGARVEQISHNGYTIKVTDFYDGTNDNVVTRLDVLFGWAATYPELACKYYTV
jgi:hypothetical protein